MHCLLVFITILFLSLRIVEYKRSAVVVVTGNLKGLINKCISLPTILSVNIT